MVVGQFNPAFVRFNDAALVLHSILTESLGSTISYGWIGDYALVLQDENLILKGSLKDYDRIDCVVHGITTIRICELLHDHREFSDLAEIDCAELRDDYTDFSWSDNDNGDRVKIRLYCDPPYTNLRPSANLSTTLVKANAGYTQGLVNIVSPIHLFKEKILEASRRQDSRDPEAIQYLVREHGKHIQPHAQGLSLLYVGLTIKRYPSLLQLFADLGVNIEEASRASSFVNLDDDNDIPGAVWASILS
ncbi:hypothetical protein F4781DRAFT_442299 [Annulohypoxylon bovei var. microspora]|nr:hypothetical protein F4781DRAFT_442299 [Annulohypoxylon bovei var. microspora]